MRIWYGTQPGKGILVLATTLCLSGCLAVGPNYTPPSLDIPAVWQSLEQGGSACDAQSGDISLWWQKLKDPTLTELMNEALQNAHDIRIARARLREARARRVAAGSGFFPSLTASGSGSRSMSSKETGTGKIHESFSAGLDAKWELDVFGGIHRGFEAADAELQVAVEDLYATQVSLAAEVATNYIEMRSLQKRLRIARTNLSHQSETLEMTNWRVQAGLASGLDLAQAISSREQALAQVPALETTLAETQHSLDILLGKNPGALRSRLDTETGLPTAPDSIAVGIPLDTLRQRPDVQAAERTLAAQTAKVGEAEAACWPAFTLSGSIGLQALTVGALGNSGAGSWSLMEGITAPIFDAGRLRAQVDIQDAAREQALTAYEQAVQGALRDVEDALASLDKARLRATALGKAAAAARSAADMAKNRYASGIIDFQTLLDTQRTALSVEDNLASSQADGVLALIRLYKAMGGGWNRLSEPSHKDFS